ncbi:MAG: RIP metalloprotease RseP [Anaerolineae bacterium]|nr:RIP metalloprotease RseP [Anaerolineae bacterium]
MDLFFILMAFGIILIPLIVIHEFGHLLACKSVGIAVLEFGIGFPPRALKLFRWGETDFTLNWVPLGGFVMPYGEDFVKPQTEEEMEPSRERLERVGLANAKSVFEASPLAKIWFLFAGPLANFLAAIVLFFAVAATGLLADRSDTTIIEVLPDTPAAASGLQPGDVITQVNGQAVELGFDFVEATEGATQPIALTVQRGDETLELTLTPTETVEVTPVLAIEEAQAGSPAEVAGLQSLDIIVAVNDTPIEDFPTLRDLTENNRDQEIVMTVRRNGELIDIPVTPIYFEDTNSVRIGISLSQWGMFNYADLGLTLDDRNLETYTYRMSLPEAAEYAVNNFTNAIRVLVSIPGELIEGNLTAEEARPVSVVGVSQIGGDIIENYPYQTVIEFAALISIALAITNLLPIPGLDGGRILFALVEIVRGKPMAPEREGVVHLIGLGLLLSLAVVLIINDLVNPISLTP